jgi:flavin reductase (DIM6/NTAB) family NADH-FMN oxidoreductase RutF
MPSYNQSGIQSWERLYRANLINSLTGFKSVSLLGTVNQKGQTNLGVFSSIVHMGSDPALIGFINRPRKAAPHTLANIESTGFYTINHIIPSFLEKAHQTSAKYPEGVSEFEEVGLTPQYIDKFPAPFVGESLVSYGLTLQQIVPIEINDTFLVIGKIQSIQLENGLLMPDGFIDLHKADTVCSNGIDSYYSTKPLGRLNYAKPGQPPALKLPNE